MVKAVTSKICLKCQNTKPLSAFHKSLQRKDGHQTWCKRCKKQYQQTEDRRLAQKRYNQSEKGKATQKRFNQSAKGRMARKCFSQSGEDKITKKRYRQNEKYKKTHKQGNLHYYEQHPERKVAENAITHAIETGRLIKANTLKCNCGQRAEHYHHHKGYAREHRLDVVALCRSCHKIIHHEEEGSVT